MAIGNEMHEMKCMPGMHGEYASALSGRFTSCIDSSCLFKRQIRKKFHPIYKVDYLNRL